MNKNRRHRAGQPPSSSLAGLARLPIGTYRLPEGDAPLIVPLREWADHMDFDRLVCERGVKRFVRPAMPSDFPVELLRTRAAGEFVYVEEVRPGMHIRAEILETLLLHVPPASRN
jgi:hypothetical protein